MKLSFLKSAVALVTCGLIAFGVGQVQADEQKLPSGTPYDQIGQKIEDYYKKNEKTSAGMVTTIVDKDGQTIYQKNFGYMDKEKKLAVDDNSVFEWGSVTKLTVWISVMQLWEEGKIDFNTDIKDYLPKDFLKGKLKFDKPITMLDLMNHRAGFDEAELYMGTDKSLGQVLKKQPIFQSHEPGTTTAYSNYGTALAGYIVERISGQKFADYVHKHIFQPLGMNHTALLPDLSDNAYVAKKRKSEKAYDAEGKLIGEADFPYAFYPAGRAAGTLVDLKKFAQALLQKKRLFNRAETWASLYSASHTFPESDVPINAHGFWNVGTYKDRVLLGHSGNTSGFTSQLSLDLKSGVAMVILTNQLYEHNYTVKIPEMIFGKTEKTSDKTKTALRPGFYLPVRTINHGPMKINRLFPQLTIYLDKHSKKLEENYWEVDTLQGKARIVSPITDYIQRSSLELVMDYGTVALWGLALLYTVLSLLIGLLLKIYRLIFKKKSKKPASFVWSIWHYVVSGLTLVSAFVLIFAFSQGLGESLTLPVMLFAALLPLLFIGGILPLFLKGHFSVRGGKKFLTYLTSTSALIVVCNILYWSLYQWWLI
ncbi:serine hydrolase domain-containing protein [Streptococcus oricebi]|uniref:Methicillin resistance protein FmtA n=1 Tax=Streptococcus oricebi TaxID=1547447 RepID=A0ABS5B142_9STRE|nr:serine hydrolase domain-containing protein [Streptococcus oricebi]MBP2622386.1 methicillin resistance protein FmtA [Streptococcus oricebi]